jgi:chaperonin GroES
MLIAKFQELIVQPLYDRDVSPGGIIIPDTAKERCDQGIVKYIGHGCRSVYIGAHVIFNGYSGKTLDIEGEGTVIILREAEIAAIVEQQPIEINGLYFRDKQGKYHLVTYEQAMYLIASDLNLVNKVDRSYDKREAKRYYAQTSFNDLNEYEAARCPKCNTIIYEPKD